jgi:malate dehydrogenase
MTIWAESDIAELGPGAILELRPGDQITPLARDRAHELGITVSDQETIPSGQHDEGRQAHTGPPSGALYRRALPLQASSRLAGPGRLRRVGIVGVGHVGATTASMIASSDLADEVVVVDVARGLAAGTALDISHVAGIKGFATEVVAVDAVDQLRDADVVVVTAGRPRRPGMSRSDLLGENAEIVGPIAETIGRVAPATILIVVSNPVDEMTELAQRASGLPSSRVLGMAGVLDAARLRAAAARVLGSTARDLDVLALGSHGSEMVIPQTLARIRDQPLADVLGAAAFERLVVKTRDAGAEIVRLLGNGSAYFAPAASIHQMVSAIADDSGQLMGACARASGQYGVQDVYLGLPVRVGRGGIEEILELELSAPELQALRDAAEAIRQRCAELPAAFRA